MATFVDPACGPRSAPWVLVVSLLLVASVVRGVGAESTSEPSAAPASGTSAAESVSPAPSRYGDEIVVTATAGEKQVEDVPALVTVETGAELTERRLARTLPEAMSGIAGVAVQKTSHGQASPYLRGFTGFRTLLLVDGVRLNNSVFRDGPNESWGLVDLHAAARLEVVFGPGSVLYGSDAVGGTAALLTADPPAGGTEAGGSFVARGASAERSGLGHASARGGVGERFGWRVGATYGAFGDLEAGGDVGRLAKSGYGFEAADFKGRWQLGGERTLTLAHQRSRLDDVWRTHATIYGSSWRGTRAGTDRERAFDFARDLTYLQLVDPTPSAIADTLWASLSWQELGEDQHRVSSSGRRELAGFDVGTGGLQLRMTKRSEVGLWTYGADLFRDRVDSARTTFDAAGALVARAIQGPVADDATYDLGGLYVQDEATISERWSLVGGVRHTRARLDAERFEDPTTHTRAAVERSWSATVGHVRALARLDEAKRWRAWFGWGQAFRAPNLSDLTRLDIARSGELEIAAPGLDPERFATVELGLRLAERRGTITVALYRTEVHGMIVRVPTGETKDGLTEVTKRNAGDGWILGVDLSGELALGTDCRLAAAASWLEGEIDGYPTASPERAREPLDKGMAPWGRLALAWEPIGGRAWLAAEVHRTGEQDRLSSRDRADDQRIPPGGSPGYTLWSLRGGWSLGHLGRLSLALENLTDAEYRVHGSGVNGPGQNLVATFAIDF